MPNNSKVLIIGISGVTCGGKTTVACELSQLLPTTKIFSQDDYFLDVSDAKHVWISELNHINFDVLSSLDMERMHHDIEEFIQDKDVINVNMSKCKSNKRFQSFQNKRDMKVLINEKLKNANLQILIVEGFSVFNYEPLRPLFHLKYYFTLPKEECFQRRSQRVYEPPDCPGYFEKCAWPEHIKQLAEVQQKIQDVKYFDGRTKNVLEEIVIDINNIIDEGKV